MFDNLLSQLRDNPRLRWGIAMIIGLFWLYAILLLRDAMQDASQQHRAVAQSIVRLRAQLAQPEWTARVISAKVLATQMEGRLWQAPTSGLAQATFQERLNAMLIQAGATHSVITATVMDEIAANSPNQTQGSNQTQASGTTTPPDLWKIKAKLGFDFSPVALMEFLKSVENNEKQIIVGTITVHQVPMPYVEMELYGYFLKQAAPAGPTKELAPK